MFDTYLSSYKNYLLERDISKNTLSTYITDVQTFRRFGSGIRGKVKMILPRLLCKMWLIIGIT